MNRSKKFLSVIFCLILCIFSASCSGCGEKVDTADFYYFNTQIHVEVYNSKLTEQEKEEISSLLSSLEKEFSVNKESSFVNKFNAGKNGQSQTLSNRAIEIFNEALECYEFSNGKFNPSVYSLSKLWQFAPGFPVGNFTPPSQIEIDQTINNGSLDFTNSLTLSGNLLTKNNENMQLDFGGIVKGYAVDKIAKILTDGGHKEGYVNAGGSSMRILSCESLGVTHPRSQGEILNITNLPDNVSVSTSGDYQKYYTYNGQRYSHIINCQTGYPSNTGILSATIICPDGTFADAISTALCLCDYDQAIALTNKILDKYPSSQIYLIYQKDNQKSIITNKNKGEDFTLLDQSYKIVKI